MGNLIANAEKVVKLVRVAEKVVTPGLAVARGVTAAGKAIKKGDYGEVASPGRIASEDSAQR